MRANSGHKNGAPAEMKTGRIPVRSRIRQQELNPVFHVQKAEEDNQILTRGKIKQALKTGVLNLAGKGLASGETLIVEIIPFCVARTPRPQG